MKTQLFTITAALCLLTTLLTTKALALDPPPAPSFTEFKMVGSNNPGLPSARDTKDIFLFEETPFLYMKISEPLTGSIKSYWSGLDNKEHARTRSITTASGTEFWFSLLYWEKDRQPGPWDINGQLWSGSALADTAQTSFVVTPEPGAFLLYGMGGIPVAVRFWKRRKKE